MTGAHRSSSCRRISSSMPSMSGMFRSSTSSGKGWRRSARPRSSSRACRPPQAWLTCVTPRAASSSATYSRCRPLSSTNSTGCLRTDKGSGCIGVYPEGSAPEPGNQVGDFIEAAYLADATVTKGFLGHAEHYAALLILGQGQGTRLVHFSEAPGAIVAHAGHDHAEGVAPGGAGDRAKQHIHRGLVAGHLRDRKSVV